MAAWAPKVGREVRYDNGDGNRRHGLISAVTSATVVSIRVGSTVYASVTRFLDQSTRMYWRWFQGRSFSFSSTMLFSSPVVVL